jgi:co-chaperonin GroES (HSP10)
MPFMVMEHEKDPRQDLLEKIGNIDDIEIFNNQVLCAVYVRPEKTKSGIYVTQVSREEDKIQGKVGLILKKGEAAFADDGEWFSGVTFDLHQWVVFRPSDGWSITINNVLCRIIDDINIRGRVQHPDQVW